MGLRRLIRRTVRIGGAIATYGISEVLYQGLVVAPREQRRAARAAERLRNAQLRQRALEEVAGQRVEQARIKNAAVASGGSIGSSSVTSAIFSSQSSLSGRLAFLGETNMLQNQIALHEGRAKKAQSIFDLGLTAAVVGSKFIDR